MRTNLWWKEKELIMGLSHNLEKIKLLQNNLLAAHTVWVNEHEVWLLVLNHFMQPANLSE